jgi:hypothetical protein
MMRGRFHGVTWNGGGNTTPAYALALWPVARGHEVTLLGPRTRPPRHGMDGAARARRTTMRLSVTRAHRCADDDDGVTRRRVERATVLEHSCYTLPYEVSRAR